MFNPNKILFSSISQALIETYLTESKLDTLVNVLKIDDQSAEFFDENFPKLSVIMANKFIDYCKIVYATDVLLHKIVEVDPKTGRRDLWQVLRLHQDMFITIRDWIQTGLNGQLGNWKNADLSQMYNEAVEWHESLEAAQADVYEEENTILLDYRNANGIGFYWADLETRKSDEECERMGHCGTTSYGNTLLSLRQFFEQNGVIVNDSHLTAAFNSNDGKIYQLKGKNNSKPSHKYHQYIVDLLINIHNITGFGVEYETSEDFKLTDLSNEYIKQLYNKRSDLFKNKKGQKALYNAGVIKTIPKTYFELIIPFKFLDNYIDFGNDNEKFYINAMVDGHISIDVYDHGSLNDYLRMTDLKTDALIEKIIDENSPDDFEYEEIEDALEELPDLADQVELALDRAFNMAYESEYYKKAYNAVVDTITDFFGKNVKVDHSNGSFYIETYLEDLINEDEIDEIEDEIESDDPSEIFDSWLTDWNYIKFKEPDYDYINIDEKYFNDLAREELEEI